jgi:isopenicillin-N N-acyltransferase like protein
MQKMSKCFSLLRKACLITLVIVMSCNITLCSVYAADNNAAKAVSVETPTAEPFKPIVVISGKNARERGIAYGKQFKSEIKDFLNGEIYEPFIGKPSSKQELIAYGAECGKVVREVCPIIADEIAGIAEGSGLTYDEIVLLHAHEEVYHRAKLPVKHGHCTAVAVAPSDSGVNHAYVGQTWDWMTRLAGKSFAIEWQRSDGPSVLGYSYPGLPFGAGMSSNGIALCWTSAALGTKGQSPRVGLPSYALIAHLLNQKDIESVITEAKRDKHAGWFTFVIADDKGNIVNVEGSPNGVVVERGKNHMVRASYGSHEMTHPAGGKVLALAPRVIKFNELLAQTAGKNSKETLQKYLDDPSNQVCFSDPSGVKKNKTIDSMLFDLTSKKAYMTRGPDYKIQWVEFRFQNGK